LGVLDNILTFKLDSTYIDNKFFIVLHFQANCTKLILLNACKTESTHVGLKSSLDYLLTHLVRGFQTLNGTTQFGKCLSLGNQQYSNDLFLKFCDN